LTSTAIKHTRRREKMTKEGDNNGGLIELGGSRMEFLGNPPSVLRRVKALKKLQVEEIDLESKFHVRLNELEKVFQPLFQRINKKVSAASFPSIATSHYLPSL
jgi:hypothetical protein